MAKFTDANGVDWTISIDISTVYEYHKQSGVDFLRIAMGGGIPPIPPLMELAYVSVRKEAYALGYKDCKEWLKGIGKGSVSALTMATAEELREFFPEPKETEDGVDEAENPPNPNGGAGA